MKYAPEDRFKGHLHQDDPRGPLTCGGGSVWPTCTAFRLRIGSSDATGFLDFLNREGVLFEQLSAQPGHDLMLFKVLLKAPEVSSAGLLRTYTYPNDYYTWTLNIQTVIISPGLFIQWTRPFEKTNIDHDVPPTTVGDPALGRTGDNCKLWQVEYDEEEPPWGWPPIEPPPDP